MKKTMISIAVFCFLLTIATGADAAGRLFYADYESDQIVEADPDTGSTLNAINSPISFMDGCIGLGFADNRLFLYACYSSTIFELNPSTGSVVNTIEIPGEISLDGLGFSGTELFALDFEAGVIYVINPDTGALIRTLEPDLNIIGGLTYAGGRNSLFVTDSDVLPSMVYEISTTTGAVINSFEAPGEIYGVGFSYERGTLFLGDVPPDIGEPPPPPPSGSENMGYSGAGRAVDDGHTIYEVNPNTGAVIGTLPISDIWALAADEAEGSGSGPISAIPSMNEWGMIILMSLAAVGSVFYLRKKQVNI